MSKKAEDDPKTPKSTSKNQRQITNYFMVMTRTRDDKGLLNDEFAAKIGACSGPTPTKFFKLRLLFIIVYWVCVFCFGMCMFVD